MFNLFRNIYLLFSVYLLFKTNRVLSLKYELVQFFVTLIWIFYSFHTNNLIALGIFIVYLAMTIQDLMHVLKKTKDEPKLFVRGHTNSHTSPMNDES